MKEVIEALGLEGASPARTLGVVAKGETRVEDNKGSIDPEFGHEETTMKLCSEMTRPDAQDLKNMKRVGRFLVGRPRVGCLFEWQAHPSALRRQTIKKIGQRGA